MSRKNGIASRDQIQRTTSRSAFSSNLLTRIKIKTVKLKTLSRLAFFKVQNQLAIVFSSKLQIAVKSLIFVKETQKSECILKLRDKQHQYFLKEVKNCSSRNLTMSFSYVLKAELSRAIKTMRRIDVSLCSTTKKEKKVT